MLQAFRRNISILHKTIILEFDINRRESYFNNNILRHKRKRKKMSWEFKVKRFGLNGSQLEEYYVFNVRSNDNCCYLHDCCAGYIKEGDIVLLQPGYNGAKEYVLNAYKIVRGLIQCKFGYNKLSEMNLDSIKYFEWSICEAILDEENCKNTIKVIILGKACNNLVT